LATTIPDDALCPPHPPAPLVRKKACAGVPLVAEAPAVKIASALVIAAKAPPEAVDHARSPIGFTPPAVPT